MTRPLRGHTFGTPEQMDKHQALASLTEVIQALEHSDPDNVRRVQDLTATLNKVLRTLSALDVDQSEIEEAKTKAA